MSKLKISDSPYNLRKKIVFVQYLMGIIFPRFKKVSSLFDHKAWSKDGVGGEKSGGTVRRGAHDRVTSGKSGGRGERGDLATSPLPRPCLSL